MDRQDVWFQLKYNDKVYNINLYEVVSAVKFAEDVKWIPQLSQAWWDKLLEMYPEFKGEPEYNKENMLYLSGEVTELEKPTNDGEYYYFEAYSDETSLIIGTHAFLEMFYHAEQENLIPKIGFNFWYHISMLYRGYFRRTDYEEVICISSKLEKVDMSQHTK